MTTINVYKSYNFRKKDPAIDELATCMKDSGMTYQNISDKSGVSVRTLFNWFEGKTRRPQSATLEAAGRAMGYKRIWTKFNDNK